MMKKINILPENTPGIIVRSLETRWMQLEKQSLLTGVLIILGTLLNISNVTAAVPNLLRLNAAGNSMQNQTVVYFDANGSFNYDPMTDAPSLGTNPGYLNIVSRFNGIDYQTKCLPPITQNISIPVKIQTGVTGSYQVYGSDIYNLPAGACLILHDNFTGSSQDLRLGAYTCTISDTENVARFVLNISISALPVSSSFLDPTCSMSGDGIMSASGFNGTAPWNYYWKDSLNTIIKTSLLKNSADTFVGASAGVYRVDITSNGACANGTVYFYLQGTRSPAALFTSADTIGFSSALYFTNNSTNSNTYWWDFGDGTGTANANPSHFYAGPGTYTVTLTAFGSVCPDSSVYRKEILVTSETMAIGQNTDGNKNIVISRDNKGYYVKFDSPGKNDAVISVSDLFGQKIVSDIESRSLPGEKVYIDIPGTGNQVFIISVLSAAAGKAYKKIIN